MLLGSEKLACLEERFHIACHGVDDSERFQLFIPTIDPDPALRTGAASVALTKTLGFRQGHVRENISIQGQF